MAPAGQDGVVYSATYSNVPVYELNVRGHHVMRRRKDNYVNATHILKVAELDKPARTRVLEKEVQMDIHEKVQGGYGKYQGTWIPQEKAEQLARKYKVEDILRPILTFQPTPGERSPPPAPKHQTAASNKAKMAKPQPPKHIIPRQEHEFNTYEQNMAEALQEESFDNSTIASESVIEDEYQVGRKRKRESQMPELSREEREHLMWADSVLDYFMLTAEDPFNARVPFPGVPPNIQVDHRVDNEHHTALHWAAAMGDIDVVKELLAVFADPNARNVRGETPLIRASLFANCYDRGVWSKMVTLLGDTVTLTDSMNGTILHHICHTANGSGRGGRAKQYLEVALQYLKESLDPREFMLFVNHQDRSGDTPFHIAVRYSRRCTKIFQGFGVLSNIANSSGETVDAMLSERTKVRRGGMLEPGAILSSSPVTGDGRFNAASPSMNPTSAPMFPVQNLKSESSKTFTKAFQSLVSTQLNEFVQASEVELEAKDNLLAETERALKRVEAERAGLRIKIAELETANAREEANDAKRQAEYDAAMAEALRLEEQIQHRQLHRLVHQEENSPLTVNLPHPEDVQEEHRRQIEALREINAEQEKRKQLTQEIVRLQADAGMGPKGELMKGIILQTLAVTRENFEADVDAVLDHMELERGGETNGRLEHSLADSMDVDHK